jgi:hypothetical protein
MLDLNKICETVYGIYGKNPITAYVNQPYYGPIRLKIRNVRQILAEDSNIEFEEFLSSDSNTDTRLSQTRRRP